MYSTHSMRLSFRNSAASGPKRAADHAVGLQRVQRLVQVLRQQADAGLAKRCATAFGS